MKWRLQQGNNICYYELGVSDDGHLIGLSNKDMSESVENLRIMAAEIGAEIKIISKITVGQDCLDSNEAENPTTRVETGRKNELNHDYSNSAKHRIEKNAHKTFREIGGTRIVCEVEISKFVSENCFSELRIVMLGAFNAGKSTLLSVLCYGDCDDGRGKARLNMMRHEHELKSGQSSSISRQLIGFKNDELVNYSDARYLTWEDVITESSKIVTFMDTCGDPKYETTTFKGLTGENPHYVCVIISGSEGRLQTVCKEQIMTATHMNVPLLLIITKIDVCNVNSLQNTIQDLLQIADFREKLKVVNNLDDLEVELVVKNQQIPLIMVSSVNLDNIDLLQQVFNKLTIPIAKTLISREFLVFRIQDLFKLNEVGNILAGFGSSGSLALNTELILGPGNQGQFVKVVVVSLQRRRCNVKTLECGQYGTAAIKFVSSEDGKLTDSLPLNFKLRRGQVLLSSDAPKTVSRTLVIDLHVVCHPSKLGKGQDLTFYSESVTQAIKIIYIHCSSSDTSDTSLKLGVGESGKVTVTFSLQAEYLSVGMQVLILGPGVKCVGSIIETN